MFFRFCDVNSGEFILSCCRALDEFSGQAVQKKVRKTRARSQYAGMLKQYSFSLPYWNVCFTFGLCYIEKNETLVDILVALLF